MDKQKKDELVVKVLVKWIRMEKINKKTGKILLDSDIKKAGIKQQVRDKLGVK